MHNLTARRVRKRPVPGKMNKLEQAYADHLRLLMLSGEITEFHFEAIKLKLAPKTFYTPDFLVITDEEIQLHEVKGHWEDDARVKIKCAAEKFWWFKFVAVTRPSIKNGFIVDDF